MAELCPFKVRKRIFDLGLQKKFEPEIQKLPGNFLFWAQKLFGGLNQNGQFRLN